MLIRNINASNFVLHFIFSHDCLYLLYKSNYHTMGKLKEYFHELICEGLQENVDADFQYEQFIEEKTIKEAQDELFLKARQEEEDDRIAFLAERADFFRIFDRTGTYPA